MPVDEGAGRVPSRRTRHRALTWATALWAGITAARPPFRSTREHAVDPYIGEIRLFPYNFAPRGWAWCEGQLLPIAQHTALFSLLGTAFGGDGRTTFGLPDLRGQVSVSASQVPTRELSQRGATSVTGTSPNGATPASTAGGSSYAGPNGTATRTATVPATGPADPGTASPYLGLHYTIALEGVYPPRT